MSRLYHASRSGIMPQRNSKHLIPNLSLQRGACAGKILARGPHPYKGVFGILHRPQHSLDSSKEHLPGLEEEKAERQSRSSRRHLVSLQSQRSTVNFNLIKALTSKKTAVHAAFLLLIIITVFQGRSMSGATDTSMLYNLIAGDEIVEGPLDPSAYAQTDAPGIGGARLAAAEGGLSVEIITFDDPEVEFAATLGGNAVIAPLSPIVAEPGSNEESETSSDDSQKKTEPFIYTVEDGDTIAGIAAKFDISTNTVLWANGLSSRDVINTGDHLTILPTTGVLHTVKSGETISEIAEEYDVDADEIVAFNNIDESKIRIGQKLIIPDGYIQSTSSSSSSSSNPVATVDDGPVPASATVTGSGLVWPTTTKHISQYFVWGHTGIDIDNRAKPPVYAAASGTVEYAGWLGGYGNLIIINHGNGLQTYYAHLEKFYVSKGETVTAGAAIAKMGSTGRSTGPHLHFEVRRNGSPINPLGMF